MKHFERTHEEPECDSRYSKKTEFEQISKVLMAMRISESPPKVAFLFYFVSVKEFDFVCKTGEKNSSSPVCSRSVWINSATLECDRFVKLIVIHSRFLK